jgi:hypothetical protein
MDSSKSIEDDTIKDQAESGYVSTRPRFTRARRTWKLNIRNLVYEDMRALDAFVMNGAARGGNAFLYPNLLPNWSFEFPALSAVDLVFGWNVPANPPHIAAGLATLAQDGAQSVAFSPVDGETIAAISAVTAQVIADQPIPCNPGEVYVFAGQVYGVPFSQTPNLTLSAGVAINFLDVNGNVLSTLTGTPVAASAAWQAYSYQFTVPANAAAFTVALCGSIANTSNSPITLAASSPTIANYGAAFWDCVGCALLTPLTPYGRMIGSAPLGTFVRFSSLPETSDIGFGQGVKRYGAHFELTEV